MKKQITPCLWFNDQAKEAATFYCSVFKQSKITAQSPIVTEIEVSGYNFILLDGGPIYQSNPSISFYYIIEDAEELEKVWNIFSKDGSILKQLDINSSKDKYGWITDKFGISWMFALDKISEIGQMITPYLIFSGKNYGRVNEAIEHYSSIFDNIKVEEILRYGDTESPDKQGNIKHSQINIDGQKLMLRESAEANKFTFSEGVSLTIYCETQQEIDYYWNKLTESGQESMCGWLKDKYGISWQIIPTILGKIMTDPEKASKAAQAFMTMKKLDIEQIVQATLS